MKSPPHGSRGKGAKVRVTLISKACLVGAYQRKLEEIAAHRDIDLTAVVPPFWREGNRKVALERAHEAGYDLVVAPVALNGHFHLHFYPSLSSILGRSRPDICHIDEEPYNLATYLAMRAAQRLGAKTIFFTWQNLLRRYPPPFSTLEKYVYRHADAAIAGNQEAAQVLRDKGYGGELAVIPQFGIDPALFRPRPLSSQEHRPFTIGYAGRLVEQKGLGTLVDALALLAGDWRLIVCGAGPMRQTLSTRLAELGLAGRVRFCDHVSSEEMPRHLGMMDLLVLPSLTRPNWKEQFGRILIEAMACEVSVVGSSSGEIPQVIGDAGLIFPEGDALGLCERIRLLQHDETYRRALGAQGRARVLAHYTQAKIAADTVELYRSIHT